MKELKKSPRQQLEKFSTIFMQLGLVLVMFIVFISLEYETEQTAVLVNPEHNQVTEFIDFETPPIYQREVIVKEVIPEVKVKMTKLINKPEIVDNIEELKKPEIIEPTDKTVSIDFDKKIEELEEEDIIDEIDEPKPVSIKFVSKIPVFAGCENLSEKEGRKCFDKKINKLIRKYFNTGLANELGLKSGKNKITTQFIIDKSGKVTDVNIRAPHARLKKETQRIIDKIPVFTPGEHNGKPPVNVRYTLPINFQVE